MQDLEQAQLNKAYELGKKDAHPEIIRCKDCKYYSPKPERKKGKWIMKYKGYAVTSYKCSECGRTVKDDTGYDVSKDYPFCHCGADMREEQDESKAEADGCIPGDC
jgi:DNA-directed RNA polymerase subunit RPC12/RpoP